jgi:hypothetical protein
VTLPRLKALLRARTKRRRDELRELALVIGTAMHDPENLDKLFKPTVSETLQKAKVDPGLWEEDEWWKSST